MGIIAKYKFNQEIYADFIPQFNTDFTDYTITDSIDTDGFTIRTIESDDLPTLMRFGENTSDGRPNNKTKSLLEVLDITANLDKTSTGFMFCNCSGLKTVNCSNLKTNQSTVFQQMFYNCSSLTSLDISNFKTENAGNMQSMFNNCKSLTSLDVSTFNTSQVTNMSNMFCNCSSLTSLDVSNFNTSQVTTMSFMFYNCFSLTSLDVSNFDTSKVTNMSYIFQSCSKLTLLDVSNFNTSQVTGMGNMFYDCSSLTSLDVSNFDTSKVTNMQGMFTDCSSLTLLDLSNFDTSQVTTMQSMFLGCESLTSINVSNFNTENVTTMSDMFNICSSLTLLDVSSFNTKNVTNMFAMFANCSSLTSLDVSNFNTSKVNNASLMFRGCTSLTLLDISNFNINNDIINIKNIFLECNNHLNIGMIYCSSYTINKIIDLLSIDTTIWYSNHNINNLINKENITYKEYKMNILESDEEINLHRVGNVCDELNLETGELIQRIDEVTFNGSENWFQSSNQERIAFLLAHQGKANYEKPLSDKLICGVNASETFDTYFYIGSSYFNYLTKQEISLVDFKAQLSENPVSIKYVLKTPIIKTINLKGKPSINWQGDTYLHLENNTLYPQLDCEIESINYYEIPKLKANTLYTLRYVGEPTQCIFGGLTYETENNMILTSGSSNNLLYFDKEVRKVILIEGDVRDRNFEYFEGIESLGVVEIVTHKTNMPIFAKGGRK